MKIKINLENEQHVKAAAAFFNCLAGEPLQVTGPRKPIVLIETREEKQHILGQDTEIASNRDRSLEEPRFDHRRPYESHEKYSARMAEGGYKDSNFTEAEILKLPFGELKAAFPDTKAKGRESFLAKLGISEITQEYIEGEELKKEVLGTTQETTQEVAQETTQEEGLTIVMVRDMLSKKVEAHREDIKAKLNELGSANVTKLEESNYPTFYDYLKGLA